MNETISFSLVMPAYKAKFLHLAIESILNQSYKDYELIIVTDASPENLRVIVDQFSDDRIIYKENKENIGGTDLVANWNHCIQFAKNDYIILATDDDTYESDFLLNASKLISKYPKVNLIRSGVNKIGEQDQGLDLEFPLQEYMTSREFVLCWAKGYTISCISNYIFKREPLLAIGGFVSFPHAHFSDDATVFSMAGHGVACISNNCTNFRVSDINLSNHKNYKVAIKQIHATDSFFSWYLKYVSELNTTPDTFFERVCYGGGKNKYLTLVEKLVSKVPITKACLAVNTILKLKHIFKNEKAKLIIHYFMNKIC